MGVQNTDGRVPAARPTLRARGARHGCPRGVGGSEQTPCPPDEIKNRVVGILARVVKEDPNRRRVRLMKLRIRVVGILARVVKEDPNRRRVRLHS